MQTLLAAHRVPSHHWEVIQAHRRHHPVAAMVMPGAGRVKVLEGPLAATLAAGLCVLLAHTWPAHGERFLAALCGTSAWGYVYFGFKIGGRAAPLYSVLALAHFAAAVVVANTGMPLLPVLFGLHALWSAALLRREWPAIDRRALESWLSFHLVLAGMVLIARV